MTIFVAHSPRGIGISLEPLYEYAKAEGHDVKFVFSAEYNPGLHAPESMAIAENFAANFNFGKGENAAGGDVFCIIGGDPLAGVFCTLGLAHEAAAANATSFKSLRYIRERDARGARTLPKYIPLLIPTGVR